MRECLPKQEGVGDGCGGSADNVESGRTLEELRLRISLCRRDARRGR